AVAHADQRRKDSKARPYINHLLEVAEIVACTGCDANVVIAALLHDVIEDTKMGDKVKDFGPTVLGYVKEMSDDKTLSKVERKREQLRHASDLSDGASIIKIADKISNIRSLKDDCPVGWSRQEIEGYVVWSIAVVDSVRWSVRRVYCRLFDV